MCIALVIMFVRSPPHKYHRKRGSWPAALDSSGITTTLELPNNCFQCCYYDDGMLMHPPTLHKHFLQKSEKVLPEGSHQVSPQPAHCPLWKSAFQRVRCIGKM